MAKRLTASFLSAILLTSFIVFVIPTPLFSVPTAYGQTPSLDTTKIAFQSVRSGNLDIYTMNSDGTGQTRLTTWVGNDIAPSWSPDGTKITFASDQGSGGSSYDVYVMDADGTSRTRLTTSSGSDAGSTFSPDGTKIAFHSNRDGNNEIYTMNADGTAQTRLTSNTASDFSPSFSPDGSKIVFSSNRDGNFEIYVMNADGSGQTRLTNNAGEDSAPSWSPDGTKIAFRSNRDGNFEIYVMNADGTSQTRLTSNTAVDTQPSWSPDGTKIAFESWRDGSEQVYTMNADGTAQTRLTSSFADVDPSWSPFDTIAPTGTILINNGATFTNNNFVNVDLTCDDGGSICSSIIVSFANGDLNTGAGQQFVTLRVSSSSDAVGMDLDFVETGQFTGVFQGEIDLSSTVAAGKLSVKRGDTITVHQLPLWTSNQGLQSVSASFTDAAGNESPSISDSITLDTIPPVISSSSDSPDPFSPNGDGIDDTTTITFTSNEAGTYSIEINGTDGGSFKTLTGAMVAGMNAVVWDGSLSSGATGSDQDYLYFISAQDLVGNQRLYAGTYDGTITIFTGVTAQPKIVFTSDRDGQWEVYVMNVDGTGQTRLTNDPSGQDYQPALSSDESKIVFVSNRNGFSEIYTMNSDGSNQVRLTNSGENYYPVFSPDGSKIAFVSTRDSGDYEIYTMNSDGSNQVRLTNSPGIDQFPSFSPDGTKILFSSERDGPLGNSEIYIMNVDGTGQTRLTNDVGHDNSPSLSPDGSKIVFSNDPDGRWDVYVMNSDGSNPIRLTNSPGFPISNEYPSFSSDGTSITFSSSRDGNSEIYIMNTDGTGQTNLTNNPALDFQPRLAGPSAPIGGGSGGGISVTTDKAVYTTGETVLVSGDVGSTVANAVDLVSVSNIGLTDIIGNPVTFQPGVQNIISFDMVNLQTSSQPYAATVQVRKSDGTTEVTTWQTGTLAASGSAQIGLSWTPQADDDYTIRVLILRDLSSNYQPLFRGATYDVRNDITTFDSAQSQAFIHALNPSGNVYRFEQVEVLNDGTFTDSFLLAGPLAEAGDYTLTAVHNGTSVQTTFTLSPPPADTTPPVLSLISDSPDPFSPNGDGTNDTTTITFTSDEAGTYRIVINGTDGTYYMDLTGAMVPGVNNAIWDGSTFVDPVGPDQDYLYYIYAQDIAGNQRLVGGSPDGTMTLSTQSKIVFTSNRDGPEEIYTMKADGTGVNRVTNSLELKLTPSWSPDGTKIVFVAFMVPGYDIWVMNADGTGSTALMRDGFRDLNPSWSPDGTKIAFDSSRHDGASQDIFVMNPDGTEIVELTNNSGDSTSPDWSPDGTKIVFSTHGYGNTNIKLAVMNSDGTGLSFLVDNSTLPAFNPSWSPDGSKIAFDNDRDIFVINSDGSGLLQLTTGPGTKINPSWSPDGSRIVYEDASIPQSEIYIMNADGTAVTNISNDSSQDKSPEFGPIAGLDITPPVLSLISDSPDPFSPDSDGTRDDTTITFTSDEAGLYTIMILTTSDGPVRNLTGTMVAGVNNAVWDGLKYDSTQAPEDTYKYNILASDSAGNVRSASGGADGTIALDMTPPTTVELNSMPSPREGERYTVMGTLSGDTGGLDGKTISIEIRDPLTSLVLDSKTAVTGGVVLKNPSNDPIEVDSCRTVSINNDIPPCAPDFEADADADGSNVFVVLKNGGEIDFLPGIYAITLYLQGKDVQFTVDVTTGNGDTFAGGSAGNLGITANYFVSHSDGVSKIKITSVNGDTTPGIGDIGIAAIMTGDPTSTPSEFEMIDFEELTTGTTISSPFNADPGTFLSTGISLTSGDIIVKAEYAGDASTLSSFDEKTMQVRSFSWGRGSLIATPAIADSGTGISVTTNGCGGDQDVDGDAICDVWETSPPVGLGVVRFTDSLGNTWDYSLSYVDPDTGETISPSRNHKDLYVEVDYMRGHDPRMYDPSIGPASAISKVKDSFSRVPLSEQRKPNPDNLPGINLHIIVDEVLPNAPRTTFWTDPVGQENIIEDDFHDLKTNHFGTITEQDTLLYVSNARPDLQQLMNVYNSRPDLKNAFPEAANGANIRNLLVWAAQFGVNEDGRLAPYAATYKLMNVYYDRPDLQTAFPEAANGANIRNLLVWAAQFGVNEDGRLAPYAATYKLTSNLRTVYYYARPDLQQLIGVYNERPDLKNAFPEAANGDMRKLLLWGAASGINEYQTRLAPYAATYKLMNVYYDRPDLQTAFPEAANGANIRNLLVWAAQFGVNEDGRLAPYAATYKQNSVGLHLAKAQVYHYGLFVDCINSDASGPSGIAEVRGNDFGIGLGCGNEFTDIVNNLEAIGQQSNRKEGTIDQQAGTLLHELGHNLGLEHGGPQSIWDAGTSRWVSVDSKQYAMNCKPNYISVMSYSRQFPGFLSGSDWNLDLSSRILPTLYESGLREGDGLSFAGVKIVFATQDAAGRMTAITDAASNDPSPTWIDWNGNGVIDDVTRGDINNFGIRGCGLDDNGVVNTIRDETMESYKDWYNWRPDFRAGFSSIDGVYVPSPEEPKSEDLAEIQKSVFEESNIDNVPPAVTATLDIEPNERGYVNTPITITWSGSDAESGIATCDEPITYSGPDSYPIVLIGSCTDNQGNIGKTAVLFGYDADAPIITAPADITMEATGSLTSVFSLGSPTVSDIDLAPTITNNASSSFPVGTTAIIWTATDAAGNTASATQHITIVDTTPPAITNIPSDITVDATSPSGATVTFAAPSATDLVDGNVEMKCSPLSGSTFAIGTTTVECSATDAHGNKANISFKVIVLTPLQSMDKLIDMLDSMNIDKGSANSLHDKLDAAHKSLDSGNKVAAKNQLKAFINEVNAQTGKKITSAQASQLISMAQRIINAIG